MVNRGCVMLLYPVLFAACLLPTALSGGGGDTWVVLVATSRYWFNYRHLSNVLAVYQIVKDFGVQDSHILLMNGFDDACGTRNPFPGQIFGDTKAKLDLCTDVQSDYRGGDVTVDALLRLLTGRHHAGTPESKKMNSNNESNVFIFFSGHGGDGFFKFRDVEEISSEELGTAVDEMELKNRYRNLLIISDTCQAATLTNRVTAKNVVSLASSGASENSYAYSPNAKLGVSLIDRFSYSLAEFFRRNVKSKTDLRNLRFSDLMNSFDPRFLQATPSIVMTDGFSDIRKIRLSLFFGSQDTSVSFSETVVSAVDNTAGFIEDSSATKVSEVFQTEAVSEEEGGVDSYSCMSGENSHTHYKNRKVCCVAESGVCGLDSPDSMQQSEEHQNSISFFINSLLLRIHAIMQKVPLFFILFIFLLLITHMSTPI
jgi:phosphatidylinositol glycan class K